MGKQVHFLNKNKPTRLMSQMIRYRNRDKGVSIKLENPMTESHGLDIDTKSHPSLPILTNRWLGTHCSVVVDLHAAP
jgi:hypothetical protein